jgi:hypothetical protein
MGDIETLLSELCAAGVRYIVGGGVAVALHGFMRAAFDLELIVDPDDTTLERARSILTLSPTSATVRPDATFAELHRRAMVVTIGDFTVFVLSVEDVIAVKRRSALAQDAVDIQALETLQKPKSPPIERLRWLDRWNSEIRSLVGPAS